MCIQTPLINQGGREGGREGGRKGERKEGQKVAEILGPDIRGDLSGITFRNVCGARNEHSIDVVSSPQCAATVT